MKEIIKLILGRLGLHRTVVEELTSTKLRKKYKALGIDIGMYSYGCFDLGRIGRNTTIGRYCSFSSTARILTRNHGTNFLSTTPYLFVDNLSFEAPGKIDYVKCVLEDDVWMGHGAIVLPGCTFIGRGAIIGAGSVVTKSVDPYTIVGGNPARNIRKRFLPETIVEIERLRWWEWDLERLQYEAKHNIDMVLSPDTYFNQV
ncbi:hypothetical protein CCR97_18425 [Rhodoplanes elegans]|uniref:Chloramphenicol acetyltransferase n=1 Tax=Rhodoplanes elegans TaxID=29408 RepID=A0A327KW79_9BRAD|nr:CatB-related O-acetyltransferase [Rhodoplanes elegans]MBK5960166.1 hypothetical protein [Rhodoplanes elegans]RAI42254.1 hypothetical protein CH338_00425 [Rhodoplanes elegans]